MCIAVFLWQAHPRYSFLLLLNRDEYQNRLTKSLEWWEEGKILGGRDGIAGGTWLACTIDGRFAFVTNFREVKKLPQAKSRGDLPVRFLESRKSPMEFAEELIGEADQYNGFNLITVDIYAKSMVYLTNRPENDIISPREVSPGIHVLSNASLDSPWPKALRLEHSFQEALDKYGEDEIVLKEMVEKLMRDTTKDADESKLPGVYSPEWEYELSSVFVESDTPLGRYGTRSSSAVSVKVEGEVIFYERCLDNYSWKECTMKYEIERVA